MLHLEARFHPELRAFLDREWVLVQVLESAGLDKVDNDVAAALDF